MILNCENWSYTSIYATVNGLSDMFVSIELLLPAVRSNIIAIRSIAFNAFLLPGNPPVAGATVPAWKGFFNTGSVTPTAQATGTNASIINKYQWSSNIGGVIPSDLIPFSDASPWYGYVKVSGAESTLSPPETTYGAFLLQPVYIPPLNGGYDVNFHLSVAFEEL